MAGADQCGEWLTLRRHQLLLEGDPLVAGKDRLTDADQAIPVAHEGRNVGNLEAAWLSLLRRSAQALERFQEEGLDVVRLQSPCLCPLHFLSDAVYTARVHGVVRQ